MRYYTRLKLYKASNVRFSAENTEAYSHDWWKFVSKHKGIIFFNSTYYSSSTSKHQSKVRSVMHKLGIPINIELCFTRKSLSDICSALSSEIFLLDKEVKDLTYKINSPRTHKKKNKERELLIHQHIKRIEFLTDIKKCL